MDYPSNSPPARIIAAAKILFFADGFERVSTDKLAKKAKVSKATLYKYFPNMSEVLRAVVKMEGDTFEAGVSVECQTIDELRDVLTGYGAGVMNFLNRPDIIQFSQLMMEEARAHPQIAARFYESGYERSLNSLSKMLSFAQMEGYLSREHSSNELAEMLMGMWEGVQWNKARMGLEKLPFPNPEARSRRCVDVLLAQAVAAA